MLSQRRLCASMNDFGTLCSYLEEAISSVRNNLRDFIVGRFLIRRETTQNTADWRLIVKL